MITVGLNGLLGNEMFQIATGTALAIENNDIAKFDLKNTYGKKYKDTIFSKILDDTCEWASDNWSAPQFNFTQPPYKPNLKLFGYFQSEKYFKNYKKEIIDLFSNELIISELRNKYESILQNSLSLHIRRNDYLSFPNIHPCLSVDYYLEGIKHVDSLVQVDHILVFSDDINFCKENFSGDRFIFIEGLKDYEDMYLMSLCKNNIIANSSFSWWGSYLNTNENKIVIFPRPWFGSDFHSDYSDIYCENSIIINSIKNMKTSVSDTDKYRNSIKLALEDESVFNRFRTMPEYTEILEHVSYETGKEYLTLIKKNTPQLISYIDEFKSNDIYGGSIKYNYDEIGEISPSTLRYIHVLSNFIKLGIDLNDKNIIEIGVGYGGQCLVLSKYFKFKSYTLVDLDEPLKLSRKYIDLNNVENVVCKDINSLEDNIIYDFVISNYAYSECTEEIQDIYYDKIIKNSIKGFMILNFISDIFKVRSYTKNELLNMIKDSYIVDEEPIIAYNNIILAWDKINEEKKRIRPKTYSQAGQDIFVLSLLKDKGIFLDVGCSDPKNINNTLLLEENGWIGVSLDSNPYFKNLWKSRNTPFIIDNALYCDYVKIFTDNNITTTLIDYLSLDIAGPSGYRFLALKKIIETGYEFKILTVSHDAYMGYETTEREPQRKLLTDTGYLLLCSNVKCGGNSFEDWWINPKYFNQEEYMHYISNNLDYTHILMKNKESLITPNINISVFTLTYQRYEILQEAIQSFLSQDFAGESEMVIINDHPNVEYVFDHPKVRIINCKERFSSLAAKIEFGYKLCKYDYIYRLDDDDLLAPWALSLTKQYIEENPGYEIYRSDHHYGFLNNKYSGIYSNINNGNVYTKKYLDRIKFPNSSFGEDVEITYGNNSNIMSVDKNKYTMLYRWGMETYHVSGMGDITNDEAFAWTDRIIKEETGVIELKPKFMNDYYSQLPELLIQ